MRELPVPQYFDASRIGEVWRVPYQTRAREAEAWAEAHALTPAAEDSFRCCLVAIDVQNTFCIPDFELFVAGRSGTGAVDDNRRLCEFLYRNVPTITRVVASLDTHRAMQGPRCRCHRPRRTLTGVAHRGWVLTDNLGTRQLLPQASSNPRSVAIAWLQASPETSTRRSERTRTISVATPHSISLSLHRRRLGAFPGA